MRADRQTGVGDRAARAGEDVQAAGPGARGEPAAVELALERRVALTGLKLEGGVGAHRREVWAALDRRLGRLADGLRSDRPGVARGRRVDVAGRVHRADPEGVHAQREILVYRRGGPGREGLVGRAVERALEGDGAGVVVRAVVLDDVAGLGDEQAHALVVVRDVAVEHQPRAGGGLVADVDAVA